MIKALSFHLINYLTKKAFSFSSYSTKKKHKIKSVSLLKHSSMLFNTIKCLGIFLDNVIVVSLYFFFGFMHKSNVFLQKFISIPYNKLHFSF